MSRLSHRSRALALAGLLGAAACTDHRVPTEVAPPAGQDVEAQISCTASLHDPQVRCGDPAATSGPADIILGGQGTYVRLRSSNVSYDSVAGVFSVDVTVQNLLSQPMGTPDGVTVTGVKVFFSQEPAATVGTGEVTVQNADGTGPFTHAEQPYFQYPQMLQPQGTSQPRTWRFAVAPTVERFAFTVYVHTRLPTEDGILFWRNETGAPSGAPPGAPAMDLYSVWTAGPHDVFVAATRGIWHWDGSEWTHMTPYEPYEIHEIAGSSREALYASGIRSWFYRYDGNAWEELGLGSGDEFYGFYEGVWAAGDTVVAVGWGPGVFDPVRSYMFISFNTREGNSHVAPTRRSLPDTTRRLWDVSGTSTADLWVVGFDTLPTATGRVEAVIMHSTDRGRTWSEQVDGDEQHRYYAGVWAGPGRVVVGGGHQHPTTGRWEAVIKESRDGGETWTETWFAVPGQDRFIREVWGSPDGTVHAVGDGGGTYVDTGSGWREVARVTSADLHGLHGAGGDAYAVGEGGYGDPLPRRALDGAHHHGHAALGVGHRVRRLRRGPQAGPQWRRAEPADARRRHRVGHPGRPRRQHRVRGRMGHVGIGRVRGGAPPRGRRRQHGDDLAL